MNWHVFFPEEFTDWLHDGVYRDLVTFENDLISISDAVVLVLESAGAIAELGLYCFPEPYKSKLFVVVDKKYYEGEVSFISHGPLRLLDAENGIAVYPFDHLTTEKEEVATHLPSLMEDVIEAVNARIGRRSFDKLNIGDIAHLIHEVISLCRAVTLSEVAEYLSLLEVDIELSRIKQLLFLVEKLGLIETKYYSNQKFFVSTRSVQRVQLGNKSKRSFDRRALAMSVVAFYEVSERSDDRKRKIVLREVASA